MTSPPANAQLSLGFSCLGHLYAHMVEPIFYVAALVLPTETGLSYGEVLGLILAGKLLYGILAPLGGWLSDRWSTAGMMAVYFIGLGISTIAAGLTTGPWGLAAALAMAGAFGSIYHPVGTAWLLRHAVRKGKAIGINGVFGGLGPVAAAGAGVIIAHWGWRWGFIIPGIAITTTGLIFLNLLRRGVIHDTARDRIPHPAPSRTEAWRAGLVLSVTMLCAGLIYQSTQPSLPKLFQEQLGWDSTDVAGSALAMGLVYLVAGLVQIVSGHLADRFAARTVYVVAALGQIIPLALLALASGPILVPAAILAVAFNTAAIPAENILLSRYTPAQWRGTAFGMKYVLAFGVSGLGIPLVSASHDLTGGFTLLYLLLAGTALIIALTALALPVTHHPQGAVRHG